MTDTRLPSVIAPPTRCARGERIGGRADRAVPRRDRRREPRAERVRAPRRATARSTPRRAVDARVAAGDDPGPLAGVPFGVKDLDDCAGMPTTHGSRWYLGLPPVRARRAARRAAARRGRDPDRQDRGARVRHVRVHREPRARRHPQPVEPRAHAGRIERRLGGRDRVGHGAVRDRRATAAAPRARPAGLLRSRRAEVLLRPHPRRDGEPLRRRPPCSARSRRRSPTARACST